MHIYEYSQQLTLGAGKLHVTFGEILHFRDLICFLYIKLNLQINSVLNINKYSQLTLKRNMQLVTLRLKVCTRTCNYNKNHDLIHVKSIHYTWIDQYYLRFTNNRSPNGNSLCKVFDQNYSFTAKILVSQL